MGKLGSKQSPETIAKRVAKLRGKKRTPEQIERMCKAQRERDYVASEETRAKISAAGRGRKKTPEQIEKTASKHRGMKRSEEAKRKMREAAKHRPPVSEETRRKLSEAGKKRPPFSEETCKKLSAALMGHVISEETKKKIGDGNRNKIVSDETRAKLKLRVGEKAANWRGGISYEPYCVKFNNDLRERVRNFFGRVCVECGKSEEENGERLSVHHISYDKNSCCNADTPLFVALCHSCHAKTNGNREYWKEHFTNIVNNQYGGKCYYSKREYSQIKQEV